MNSKQNRIHLISQIIENETVRSQSEIIRKLEQKGVSITQASLSRYLKELQASRIPDGENGYIYKVPQSISKATAVLSNEVVSVEFAGSNMAVLKTLSGYANAVSAQIDSKNMPPIAGTISGDDTILIIIRDGFSKKQVKDYLSNEFKYIKNKFINE
ncbi:MAG: ArgR family transcriptional regulator [Bacteroidales bacterium]|nr:ArgR family transcriptional regulator [Bacteroidales bacterium]